MTQKHIDFYTKQLGMQLLRQRDIPEDKYSNAFLGYGPETTNFAGKLPLVDLFVISGWGWGVGGVLQLAPTRTAMHPWHMAQRPPTLQVSCSDVVTSSDGFHI